MTTVDLQSRSELVTPETCLPLTLDLIVDSQHVLYNSYMVYFTRAGDWDFVAAVERIPALHYGVDFIFLSFWIMGFIVAL